MSLLWDYIRFPFNFEKSLPGEDYQKNFHNPINDSIRFVLFIFIPIIAYFSFKIYVHKKKYFFFLWEFIFKK